VPENFNKIEVKGKLTSYFFWPTSKIYLYVALLC